MKRFWYCIGVFPVSLALRESYLVTVALIILDIGFLIAQLRRAQVVSSLLKVLLGVTIVIAVLSIGLSNMIGNNRPESQAIADAMATPAFIGYSFFVMTVIVIGAILIDKLLRYILMRPA